MKFSDSGIIISQKNYGENSLIVKVFSQNHGIYRGFVRSAKSAKSQSIFQIGNLISFEFRSRIEDNLGQFLSVDLVKSYGSKILFDKLRLDCANSIFSIIDGTFLERENYPQLFESLQNFLQKISAEDDQKFLTDYIRLELDILKTLGYGIDLSSCVVTSSRANLTFVSPKSAQAVSFEAGEKYKNKLLKLPSFLVAEHDESSDEGLLDGLKLSGFFLQKFLFEDGNSEKHQRYFFHRDGILRYLVKANQ